MTESAVIYLVFLSGLSIGIVLGAAIIISAWN